MIATHRFGIDSLLAHAGTGQDPVYGSVTTPIYQTVTFQHRGDALGTYDYSRTRNPTRSALEEALTRLEGGAGARVFASGMAAITALFLLLHQGDHILLTDDLYGGTYRVLTDYLGHLGLDFDFVDTRDPQEVERHWRGTTRMLFVETPSNPVLRISDIRALAALAHRHDARLVVDNTFMTFYRQRPLELGADIVVYSATKYLAGHNDVLAGALVAREPEDAERLGEVANGTGGVLGPLDAYLTLRGLKTLGLRLTRQEENARRVARALADHPAVARVYYPELDPEANARHRRQAGGPGGMVSFVLRDPGRVAAVMDRLQLVLPAVSLGGTESLITHPYSETHRELPEPLRRRLGIVPGLLRLSAGVEDPDDLIWDLRQALA
ncbi:MAG: PLP-dependent aspartate aminotransferase family protein [Firmicutes bacterium]|nr:PLP-dependent aspartate aminotransferase family protein [Bacillota bacterium]